MKQRSKQHLILGEYGEKKARVFFEQKGFSIREERFRSPYGEIDLIVTLHSLICFVEVKTRSNRKFGKPEEALSEKKIQKILQTAEYYLQKFASEKYREIRFDVVSLEKEKEDFKIRWIQGAFE